MTDQPKADERGRSLPPVSPAEEHRAATTRTVSDIFAQLAQMQGEGDTTPEHAQEDQRVTAQGVQEPYEQH